MRSPATEPPWTVTLWLYGTSAGLTGGAAGGTQTQPARCDRLSLSLHGDTPSIWIPAGAVVDRIDIGELRDGVRRHHRTHGFAPPKRVLLEFCRQLPGVDVEGTYVWANPSLDWVIELEETEETMVRILKTHSNIMQRSEFEALCRSAGMNRATFYIYLGYSPVLTKFARGVYGLRGTVVRPGAVEALAPRRLKGKVLQDYGWTDDGKIWLGYTISEAMLASGVFGIPSAMHSYLAGEYRLRTMNDVHVGAVVAKEANGWGLSPFFRRRDGDPGDTLVIVFDLAKHEAVVSIGDSALLEEFQDADDSSASVAA